MLKTIFGLIILLVIPGVVRSGTVISTNLPAGTAIVNINAKQDGAASWNGGQDSWFDPFFTGGATSLLQHTVQPGTYTFRLTNPTLAASEFPALTPAQLGQMFTAWTYNSPWITDYFVFDAAGAASTTIPQIFAGAIRPVGLGGGTGSATQAFQYAVDNNYDDIIVKQPGGRTTGVRVTEYAFAAAETLTFAIPDNILSDNNGGLSIVVSPVITADLPGDYNDNGNVDAADYVVWRKTDGTSAGFNTWRANFGVTAGGGPSAGSGVPEPATSVLLMFAAAGPCLPRRGAA